MLLIQEGFVIWFAFHLVLAFLFIEGIIGFYDISLHSEDKRHFLNYFFH